MTDTQTPFSPIDELMELTDSARYPVNVHIEAKAPGKLKAKRMRRAVHKTLETSSGQGQKNNARSEGQAISLGN